MHMHHGLTGAEARARLVQFGPNSLATRRQAGFLSFLIAPLLNPLVGILLASALLAEYFGEVRSAVIIVAIVVVSAFLDFFNSFKSDRAAKKLRERVRVTTAVLRDGKLTEVPVEKVVVGDWVRLSAGDIVPADGVVRSSSHCYANESSLTGEAFPQPKDVGASMYMGSSVATGEAEIEVTAIGQKTEYAAVVAALAKREVPTEFDREIKAFSGLILKITVALVVFVFVVNAALKGDILQALLFAAALAVGITPELLPMITTLNLTRGSLAMAKRGVIVKKLSSIQKFGSMDVLCTDKTGTLTEDSIELVKYVDGRGEECEATLRFAYLNSVLTTSFKNPLDEAIREFRHLGVKGYKKIDELPFDFQRRRESIVVDHEGKRLLITKGSPEGLFKICSTYRGHEPFKKEIHAVVTKTYEKLSRGGFRVLAIATKEVGEGEEFSVEDEAHMSFQGFVAFLDPPKLTVERTLSRMQALGITIKIVTGDNELTTCRIAQEIGLEVKGVVLGAEVEDLSDAALRKKVEETNVFARVSPSQKLRIIQALQARGHVVGYMGDGINDAPSLKASDIGVSVSNATDIAKESADFILIHKSLADLVDGVVEGRRTFVNTLKYLRMVLSSNFGNVFSMAGASLFLPFLPMLPTQILLNNLLYDLTQFSLPLDRVDADEVNLPRRLDLAGIKRFMSVFGPLSSLFDLSTFVVLCWGFHLGPGQFRTGWFLESLATQVFVVYVVRTKRLPFINSRPGLPLLVTTIGGVVLGWYVALGPLGTLFGFERPSLDVILSIVAIVAIYLVTVELVKQRFFAQTEAALHPAKS